MADKAGRNNDNIRGKYYVDEQCIACELCATEAPHNFKMADDGAYAFCYKQPSNSAEEDACISAMSICPASAIGDDGE
jgi:ferredoxin